MESYHNDNPRLIAPTATATSTSTSTSTATATPTATETPTPTPFTSSLDPESGFQSADDDDYDRLRRGLLAKTIQNEGWRSELRRYLDDMPSDVTKDTDVVEWWSVSRSSVSCCLTA
jgi:hypothetical protein